MTSRRRLLRYCPQGEGEVTAMQTTEAGWNGEPIENMMILIGVGVTALVAGILILLVPGLLNFVVAVYLIVFGILTLLQR